MTDLETGDRLRIPVLENCEAIYPDWSPDGTMLLTSCYHQIIIQSFPGGTEISRVPLENPDHPGEYSINHALWSLDGKYISYIESNHGVNPESRDKVIVLNGECLDNPPSCQETRMIATELQPSGSQLDRLGITEPIGYSGAR